MALRAPWRVAVPWWLPHSSTGPAARPVSRLPRRKISPKRLPSRRKRDRGRPRPTRRRSPC
eukprot:6912535-Alexandrium_andersonii.AAC.1